MPRRLWVCLSLLACVPLLHGADASDRLVVAAMKLTDQPNYSWQTTVADDARSYEVSGQTTKGGYTRVRTPVPNSVRRRLGKTFTDQIVELVFKGNVNCVIETEDGWKVAKELPPPEPAAPEPPVTNPLSISRRKKATPPPEQMEPGPYSNLQLSICHPHEELGIIVTSHSDVQIEGDIATGKLNDLGTRLLLVHDGQPEITPLSGSGSFKVWIRNGAVTRYTLTLDGVIRIETPAGTRDVRVHQTMDTTLRDIGTTKFEVPEEAKLKLR